MGKLSPFEWMNYIVGKRKNQDEIDENLKISYEPFMINRIISNDIKLLKIASMLNRPGFSDFRHFNCLRSVFQQIYKEVWDRHGKTKFGRDFYIPYSKKSAKDKDIKAISDYYDVNLHMAEKYLDWISKEELAEIKAYYKDIEKYKKPQKVR